MKKVLKWGVLVILFFIFGVLSVNCFVKISTSNLIVSSNSKKLDSAECALVLGAATWNGAPSPMLKDRLDAAILLYKKGIVPKIIMSGDHRSDNYNEVKTMKKYAIDKGVPSEDIFLDHAGISTYDSVYRAKAIFNVNKIIIVTQKYHLYRSLYIAKSLGLEAYGVEATRVKYRGQLKREIREILARDKDFVKSIFKPKSEYMGEAIEVSGNGDVTNDKS